MNIIEAIQAAQNGALIRNGFMKEENSFLKFIKNDIFYEYELVDEKPVFKYNVRSFTIFEITTTSWEVLPKNYFDS